jgi:hypothetical protein
MFNKKYTKVENIENYLGLDVAVEFQGQIDTWIIGMSEFIKNYTNRDWLADETPQERYFDGNGFSGLEVGDFIGEPTLKIGDSFGENMEVKTEFITHPYNTISKNTIVLKRDFFRNKIKNVSVTARWGYSSETPRDIEFATTVLVAGIILAQTNQQGEVKSEKIGNYTVTYESDAQKNDFKNAMDIINQRKLTRI